MKKILILILLLGAVLRLAYLGGIPIGFFRDEAAIGYNAYSLAKTGMDEFGVKFPLVFRSFEVFFLPLYIYLSVAVIKVLGLTVFSVRLLSALSGIAAIYLVYLIAKEIWNEKAGVICAFILAISPWHIFYSRGAFEGNLALTLFTLGFYCWLIFLKKKKVLYFLVSTLGFALSMYSYQAERVIVPLFALAAILFSFRFLWQIKDRIVLPLIIIGVVLIPLLLLSFKAGGYHRAFGVSVFSQEVTPPGWIEGRGGDFLINNTFYLRFREITSLYLSYFSPRNLFIEGDYDRERSVENFSVFYIYMLPALVWGVWRMIKEKPPEGKLLAAWLFMAPIPAALTGDPFHTYRSLLLYMPLSLLIGYGFSLILVNFPAKFVRNIFLFISFTALSIFIFNYGVLTQVKRAHDWDFGYKEIVSYVDTLPKDKKVVVDDPWTQAYIHFLFFGKIEPSVYQQEVGKLGDPMVYYYSSSDKIRPQSFENLEFRVVDWPKERGDRDTVFVMWSELLPESEFKGDPKVKLLKEIFYPDGSSAFRIVEII
jgi:4-amino-4-deoxy-L-arabinose transferase-like glycosyltransferase